MKLSIVGVYRIEKSKAKQNTEWIPSIEFLVIVLMNSIHKGRGRFKNNDCESMHTSLQNLFNTQVIKKTNYHIYKKTTISIPCMIPIILSLPPHYGLESRRKEMTPSFSKRAHAFPITPLMSFPDSHSIIPRKTLSNKHNLFLHQTRPHFNLRKYNRDDQI